MFFGHLFFFYDKKLFQQAHELPGQKLRSNSKTKPGFAAKRGLLPDGHTVEVCFFKVEKTLAVTKCDCFLKGFSPFYFFAHSFTHSQKKLKSDLFMASFTQISAEGKKGVAGNKNLVF